MLNKQLYDKLRAAFGEVEVIDAGVKPKLKLIPDTYTFSGYTWAFDKSFQDYFGESYRFNCPICGDKKKHCYVSALSFSIPSLEGVEKKPVQLLITCFRRNCFKNNKEARDFVTKRLSGESNVVFEINEEQSIFGSSRELFSDMHKADADTLLKWQPDYKPVTNDAPAEVLDYIDKRGIRQEDITELSIGYGKCWNFKTSNFIGNSNWLQFPIIDQGGLRGFQSRQLRTTDKLKYYFDPRTPKKMCLYNRLRAVKFPVVAIAEGVIDALHIGRCGMAFFGSSPSKAQVKLLQQDGAKMVLYIPDQKKHYTPEGICDLDPTAIANECCNQWNQQQLFEWGAYRIDVPGDDAGECTMTEVWNAIIEQLARQYSVEDYVLESLFSQVEKM